MLIDRVRSPSLPAQSGCALSLREILFARSQRAQIQGQLAPFDSTDGSADTIDLDADGHNTWQEWRCRTDPTNALSALRLLPASPAGTNVTVSWQSEAGVSYLLERSTNITGSPPTFTPIATNISGQPGTTCYTDTDAEALSSLFYRVGVRD